MESRIGSLALRVRAPAGASEIGPASEDFAIRVLRRFEERLSERAPGRIFLLKTLDLSMRLRAARLSDDGEIEACADEIAESVEASAAASGEEPRGDPEIAVFADEATWRAAHLEARAKGEGAHHWRFAALEEEGEPFQTLLDGERAPLLLDVLSRLRSRGTLRRSLAALPRGLIEILARVVGGPVDIRADGTDEKARELPGSVEAVLRALDGSIPTPLAAIELGLAARETLGPFASPTEIARIVRSALSTQATASRAEDVEVTRSAFGGLLYLLNPALELGLGQILWRVCLPERVVLARASATLLGARAGDDPIPVLFGGARPGDPLTEVLPEQQAEVAGALLEAVLEALPRRGLAEVPEAHLRLVDTADGRLLGAFAGESAFSLFALPARTPEETRSALDTFLGIWPASGPTVSAERALAELDRRARVRALSRKREVPLLLADGPSLLSLALVTQAAGTLAYLFMARLCGTSPPFSPTELVERHLAVLAEVSFGADAMRIEIPAERVDLAVRRAGLDRDPGWVPWIERHVRFEFAERPSVG